MPVDVLSLYEGRDGRFSARWGGMTVIWDHECPHAIAHLRSFLGRLNSRKLTAVEDLLSPARGRYVMLKMLHGSGEIEIRSFDEPERVVADLRGLFESLAKGGRSLPIVSCANAPALTHSIDQFLRNYPTRFL